MYFQSNGYVENFLVPPSGDVLLSSSSKQEKLIDEPPDGITGSPVLAPVELVNNSEYVVM